MNEKQPTMEFACFAAQTNFEDLPEDVVGHTKILILDAIGDALFGTTTLWGKQIIGLSKELGGPGEATIWGDGTRVGLTAAPIANGTLVHAFELEDTHREAKLHVNCTLAPAAVAVGEKLAASGKEVILGMAIGSEITIRIALGADLPKAGRRRGWHPTGVCGVFGAAACAGRMMDLDTVRMANALGLAGVQPVGLWAFKADGSNSKRFHPGKAASDGILAAMLARSYFTGPTRVLEAEDGGWCEAISGVKNYGVMLDGLGSVWEVPKTGIKPFPSVRSTHAMVAALLGILNDHPVPPEQIRKVIVRTRESAKREYGWDYAPGSITAAQLSIPYVICITAMEGDFWIDQLMPEKITSEKVRTFMKEKIEIITDERIEAQYPRTYTSGIDIELVDGTRYSNYVDYPPGDPENPLSQAQLEEKFRKLSAGVLDERKVQQIINMVNDLEAIPHINQLTALLAP